MKLQISYDKEQALKKIKRYCSYQERCHKEVREKLYSYQLRSDIVNQIIANLIENNFLNEERFAKQFSGGKFRMKSWGKKKIEYALKQKGASEKIVQSGLKEIDAEDYFKTLKKVAVKKWNNLNGTSNLLRKSKVYKYLLQKGFEQELIAEVLKNIESH